MCARTTCMYIMRLNHVFPLEKKEADNKQINPYLRSICVHAQMCVYARVCARMRVCVFYNYLVKKGGKHTEETLLSFQNKRSFNPSSVESCGFGYV